MNPAENGKPVRTGNHLKKACLFPLLLAVSCAFAQTTPGAGSPGSAGEQDLGRLALAAEQFLIEKTKDLAGKAEITISPLDSRLKLPACEQPIAYLSQGAKVGGKTTVAIRCEAPQAWRIMVKAHVRIFTPYLTAARVLPQGHVIGEGDLALVTGDVTALRPGVLTRREQAIGRTVARALQPGSPVWAEQLRAAAAIQQGQAVRVVSKGPGFAVSGEGHAINSANEGQVAKAKMANGSLVRGIAKADGIIEVNF